MNVYCSGHVTKGVITNIVDISAIVIRATGLTGSTTGPSARLWVCI